MSRAAIPDKTRPGPKSGKADVRAMLLDAAKAIATEKGVETMSLRDIADRAGVNQAMIRYYFGDKQGLLTAMLDDGFADLLKDAPHDASAETQLAALTSALSSMPWLPVLMIQAVYADTPLRNVFLTRHAPHMMASLQALMPDRRGDPLTVLALLSALVFPHIARPLVGAAFGAAFDGDFARDYSRVLAQRLVGGSNDAT